MNFKKLLFPLCLIIMGSCQPHIESKQELKLWYKQPAGYWEEALPLGNGTTGAMVWGGVSAEHYSLNDHTLWSGGPEPGNVKEGPEILKKVRDAIDVGHYEEAGKLWKRMHGPYSARYLPLGDLFLKFDFSDTLVSGYTRDLDLRKAFSVVRFQNKGVIYNRETFISYPDQAMVIRLTASKKHKISFEALLSSRLHDQVQVIAADHLRLTGKAPKHVAHRSYEPEQVVYDGPDGEGMTFEIDLKLIATGGELISKKNGIGVRKADEVLLLLTEATSINGFAKPPGLAGKDPSLAAMKNLDEASGKPYDELRKNHLTDYTPLLERVELDLGAQRTELPTDKRMQKFNAGNPDNGLIALYFQFGRYLMLASSRDGSVPANLQGIWNPHVQPPWGSNYTLNINTEMNYWPAEVTNLSECHTPLFNFMKHLAVNGAVTAKVNYGISQGWVAHHNSDIWAKTSPSGGGSWDPKGSARWSCWPMAGAWLCQHLWEHYRYTGDRTFLQERAWPLMKGAAAFMLDWMVRDENGYWVTNPSSSPENIFTLDGKEMEISKASTMDMSVIRELFAHCLDAARVLDIQDDFTARVNNVFPNLYPFHIGQYGQVQEWSKDWDDPSDKHRHISQLFSLYPGDQITPESTPELACAAKRSLIQRGDVSTGWSMAWKVNWWARLRDGNHALRILEDGLTCINPEKENNGGGGTYPNLLDAHPPFQIDGNFGGTAGIAEMLLQSHEGYIYLLPALPDKWPDGQVRGLVARGGFVVSMTWQGGKLKEATVYSRLGGMCRIKANERLAGKGFVLTEAADGTVSNPLLKTAPVILCVNNSKVAPVDLKLVEGDLYEWKTMPGQNYCFEAKE